MRIKDQNQSSTQNNPHLAAMLTGQSGPTMQGQISQNNQQMQMTGQLTQQQIGQGNQMSGQQMGVVSQMGNSINQNNPQMNLQMVGQHSQGMGGMGGIGQPMTMGGVSVSHSQPMGMGGQPNQMVANSGQPNQMGITRMGPGNQVLGSQMTMVGQGPNMAISGGQVISNANTGMIGQNPGMVGSRMTSTIGIPGQGGDMNWSGNNAHMSLGVMNSGGMGGISGPMGTKMGPIQMPIGQQVGVGQIPGIGRGGVVGNNIQPRISSPGYVSTAGGIQRQNIPSTISSPMGIGQAPGSQPQLMTNQQSPVFISPSPTSNPVPSPVGGRAGLVGVPSPGQGSVNTPGQPMQPSPGGPSNQMEDKAYTEKINSLKRFIPLLKDQIDKAGDQKEGKMMKLLDILQNPEKTVTMEILQSCENVLEKRFSTTSQSVHKEDAVKVLMEGIRETLNSRNPGSIFHKTLAPALQKLNYCPIPLPPLPKKRKLEQTKKDPNVPKISFVVQGEVARLSSRFKVNLDTSSPRSEKDDLTLTCHLDDTNLPCVPPLTLTVPEKYPRLPPIATLSHLEYSATDFLKLVKNYFLKRQKNLPLSCSITMLLDTWEMSIRHACSPNASKNPDALHPITAFSEIINKNIKSEVI